MIAQCDLCRKPCDDKGNHKLIYGYVECWHCHTRRARKSAVRMILGTIGFAVMLLAWWLR